MERASHPDWVRLLRQAGQARMLAFGGGGGLISASEYIERLEGLIRKHACPPVQEEDGWECPLCAWMEEEVRDEI